MKRKRLIGSIAAACAAAALTAGIAEGSGSSSSRSSAGTQSSSTSAVSGAPDHHGPGGPGGHGPGGPDAVHSVSVVLNKAKNGFVTETSDSGTIESVDSNAATIAIVEGTKSVTYKIVTVTIPAEASVTLDGKKSTLSALAKGERVMVSSSSDGTTVMAIDSSFRPERGSGPGTASGQAPPAGGSSSPPSETTTSG
jgi:hypothetical protein